MASFTIFISIISCVMTKNLIELIMSFQNFFKKSMFGPPADKTIKDYLNFFLQKVCKKFVEIFAVSFPHLPEIFCCLLLLFASQFVVKAQKTEFYFFAANFIFAYENLKTNFKTNLMTNLNTNLKTNLKTNSKINLKTNP